MSLHIAGTAASALDAEITACVSACVTHSLRMDSRIERRLHDIAHALEDVQVQGTPEVAAYCTRLNKLVSAVLVNATPASVPETRMPSRRSSRCGRRCVGGRRAAHGHFGSNLSDKPFMQ